MEKMIVLLAVLLTGTSTLLAQNVGIGTTTPDASAVLELKASNKGFLPPRMTAAQKVAIISPKAGLIIYQTNGATGLYIFNGAAWVTSAFTTNSWTLNGNAGTDPINNFIGTTDDVALNFKVFNGTAGRIEPYTDGGPNPSTGKGNLFLGHEAGTLNAASTGKFNTGIGTYALRSNTNGFDNVSIGMLSLYNNTTGNFNTAEGSKSLFGNSVGNDNTANGYQSLFNNQTGHGNTAAGSNALFININGSNNVAVGDSALYLNLASGNVAVGSKSLYTNALATGNTAIGFESLNANDGDDNTAAGYSALHNNTTGTENTALGNGALYNNITGSYNAAVGYGALNQNKASFNTALGNKALSTNNTGVENTATGNQALLSNIDGSYNVANGSYALTENISGIKNTALGYSSLKQNKGSNNTAIGYNALNKNIIGTNNTATGDFSLTESLGSFNTANGSVALINNTTGFYNTAVGVNSLSINTTGSNNVGIGYSANVETNNLSNATAVGSNAIVGCSSCLVLGSTSVKVGIGLSIPQTALHVKQPLNGLGLRLTNSAWDWDIYTSNGGGLNFNYNGINKAYIDPVNGSYVATSDARLKKEVNKMGSVLNKVMALQPKTYKYLDNKETDPKSTGFIAQEVMALFPDLVSDFKRTASDKTDTTVYHGINYAGFSVVAIKAVQEQQLQIEALQTNSKAVLSDMDLLKAENKLIQKQMVKMQAVIDAMSKK